MYAPPSRKDPRAPTSTLLSYCRNKKERKTLLCLIFIQLNLFLFLFFCLNPFISFLFFFFLSFFLPFFINLFLYLFISILFPFFLSFFFSSIYMLLVLRQIHIFTSSHILIVSHLYCCLSLYSTPHTPCITHASISHPASERST